MRIDKMRYAVGRVDQILQERLEQIKKSCTKPGSVPTARQKLQAVRDGTASLKRGASVEDSIEEAFVFNIRVQEQFDRDRYEKLSGPVKDQAARIKDEIMLGSEQDAVKMIEKFRLNKS